MADQNTTTKVSSKIRKKALRKAMRRTMPWAGAAVFLIADPPLLMSLNEPQRLAAKADLAAGLLTMNDILVAGMTLASTLLLCVGIIAAIPAVILWWAKARKIYREEVANEILAWARRAEARPHGPERQEPAA